MYPTLSIFMPKRLPDNFQCNGNSDLNVEASVEYLLKESLFFCPIHVSSEFGRQVQFLCKSVSLSLKMVNFTILFTHSIMGV